jgi:hypothetical protein
VASLKSTDGSRMRAYADRLRKLEGVSLVGGILGTDEATEAGTQLGSGHPPASPSELAEIALRHEFGEGVPVRAWLRPAIAERGRSWVRGMKAAIPQEGSPDGHEDRGLRQVAQVMRGDLQSAIRDGDHAPNSESTIAAKGSNQPLIDTGQMLQSVRVAREGGGPSKVLA